MAGAALRSLITAAALAAAYLLFWPVAIEPQAWHPGPAPALEGDFARNDLLVGAELVGDGMGHGPEDIAFGPDGWLYTGLDDGSIVKVNLGTGAVERFAETGGRPAGMKFAADGTLIVADVRRGLLSVRADGGVQVLVEEIAGRPLHFANDLDIDANGVVYFSESSAKYAPGQTSDGLLEHVTDGALHAYDPKSGALTTVIDGLAYANGVALNQDQSAVYVAELGAYRVQRVWLRGERAGTSEVYLDNLPGFPDNLNTGSDDTMWVALGIPRMAMLDVLAPYPFLRKIMARLPGMSGFPRQAIAVQADADGKIVRTLQDPDPEHPLLTSVYERDGTLYMGNLFGSGVYRLSIP
jgi:sugar lactone lactonase YvrE